jgi:hypothetical protein
MDKPKQAIVYASWGMMFWRLYPYYFLYFLDMGTCFTKGGFL